MCMRVCVCVCVSVYTVFVDLCVRIMFHMTLEFMLHADHVVQSDDLLKIKFSCESMKKVDQSASKGSNFHLMKNSDC